MTTTPFVSIVVPVLRDTEVLVQLLEALAWGRDRELDCEVVVANGDPTDRSLPVLRSRFPDVRWVESERGRSTQMNAGARQSTGKWLLFLHADTIPDPGWSHEIRRIDEAGAVAGAFRFALASKTRIARVLERGVRLRVWLFKLPYGDQGIFVRREVFEALGGYGPLPIMEDIDLVRRLARRRSVARSSLAVRASARRWERDGWIRRSSLNLLFVMLFLVGVSPGWLARRYYGRAPTPVSGGPVGPSVPEQPKAGRVEAVVVIVPALDEEAAIGQVLDEIPDIVTSVTVVDNGSVDRTAACARRAGAHVITEPRRGYGRACLRGLQANPDADIVVFLDADRSDYPEEMTAIVAPILAGQADFVLGDRAGVGRPLSARIGTSLCVSLINLLWHSRYRDLGPFRAIRREALDRIQMADQTWGWTIEMQVKAVEAGLRTLEVPVRHRPRIGSSKISGTLTGTLRAGSRMLLTIWSLWRTRSDRKTTMRAAVNG